MRKKKRWIWLIIIAAIFVISVLAIGSDGGIGIQMNNFVYTNKFYENPETAFAKNYKPSGTGEVIEIKSSVYTYDINDTNSLYVALTNTSTLVCCQMYTKNNQYYFLKEYTVCNLERLVDNVSSGGTKYKLFASSGKLEGSYEFFLSIDTDKYATTGTKIYDFVLGENTYPIYLVVKLVE